MICKVYYICKLYIKTFVIVYAAFLYTAMIIHSVQSRKRCRSRMLARRRRFDGAMREHASSDSELMNIYEKFFLQTRLFRFQK